MTRLRGCPGVLAAALVASAFLRPGFAGAFPITLEHDAVECVASDRFPIIRARVTGVGQAASMKVMFRPAASPHWYAVAMRENQGTYQAELPKPKKSLPAFDYYVEGIGAGLDAVRTPEHRALVESGRGACAGKVMAGAAASATVLLEVAAGAPAVPAGFASSAIVATGSGAAGGGLSLKGVLLATAAAGAAAAGAAVSLLGGGPDVDIQNIRFEPSIVTCPDGASGTPIEVTILVDLSNRGGETVTFGCGDCVLTLCVDDCGSGTAVGQIQARGMDVVPARLEGGASAPVTLQARPSCTNPAGPTTRSVAYEALFFLSFNEGNRPTYTLNTMNRLRIDYP